MLNFIIVTFVGGACYIGYRYYKVMAKIKKNIEEKNAAHRKKNAHNLVYDKKTGQYIPEKNKDK